MKALMYRIESFFLILIPFLLITAIKPASLPLSYQSRLTDERIKNLDTTNFQIEGFTLRRAYAEDFPQIIELYRDKEVRLSDGIDIPDEMIEQWLNSSEQLSLQSYLCFNYFTNQWSTCHHGYWMIYDIDDSLVGIAGILNITHLDKKDQIEFLITTKQEIWNKGYIIKLSAVLIQIAFEKFNKESLVFYTPPSCAILRHLLKNLGFTYEKEIIYQNQSNVLYRLTQEEYQKVKDVIHCTPYID